MVRIFLGLNLVAAVTALEISGSIEVFSGVNCGHALATEKVSGNTCHNLDLMAAQGGGSLFWDGNDQVQFFSMANCSGESHFSDASGACAPMGNSGWSMKVKPTKIGTVEVHSSASCNKDYVRRQQIHSNVCHDFNLMAVQGGGSLLWDGEDAVQLFSSAGCTGEAHYSNASGICTVMENGWSVKVEPASISFEVYGVEKCIEGMKAAQISSLVCYAFNLMAVQGGGALHWDGSDSVQVFQTFNCSGEAQRVQANDVCTVMDNGWYMKVAMDNQTNDVSMMLV